MRKLPKLVFKLLFLVFTLFIFITNSSNLPVGDYIKEQLLSLSSKKYENTVTTDSTKIFDYDDTPKYEGDAYIELNNNIPYFTEFSEGGYTFAEFDDLGRCGEAIAVVGPETLATEERGSIRDIKPSGWHTIRYDDLIGKEDEPGYLYNRCHLIMYALLGQESNVKENLITGTRYLNVEGMLPNEIKIVNYIEETGNHVEYRATPIFIENELIARGVLMQARSIESDDFMMNVFCYNVQPGIEINYKTGDSKRLQ